MKIKYKQTYFKLEHWENSRW